MLLWGHSEECPFFYIEQVSQQVKRELKESLSGGNLMDKNIQYILEVARQGGITKAANKLYITPSALSRFVQARESELNVLLFHRIGNVLSRQKPENTTFRNVRK